jgi:hypothetical protein
MVASAAVWIAFRLFLALAGFVIRHLGWFRSNSGSYGVFEGVPYGVALERRKRKIRGFSIWMQRKSPTWLRVHRETKLDVWVKRIGFAKEIQTGDPAFDALAYITCDHPFIERALTQSEPLRDAIAAAIQWNYERVEFDGERVILSLSEDREPSKLDLTFLKRIWSASEDLQTIVPNRFAEPFLWKALAVECVIWSLCGYSIGAVMELLLHRENIHVFPRVVAASGFLFGCALFALLVGSVALLMRGSSRGHRVLVESALILGLALPTAGVQLVADTNRALDRGAPRHVKVVIDRCEVREHRGRRGRRSHSYHLGLARDETSQPLPQSVEVTPAICRAAQREVHADFTLRPGRWGIPWYEEIRVGNTLWMAPL